jgi:hypothetical protein
MKTEHNIFISAKHIIISPLCMAAGAVLLGGQTGSAQTVDYLYSGSNVVVTLNPGTYDIIAYGAQGGAFNGGAGDKLGGLGAEMEGEFNFPTAAAVVPMAAAVAVAVATRTRAAAAAAMVLKLTPPSFPTMAARAAAATGAAARVAPFTAAAAAAVPILTRPQWPSSPRCPA